MAYFTNWDISSVWYRSCAGNQFWVIYDDQQAQHPRFKFFAAGTHHAAMPEGYAKFMIKKIFFITVLSFYSFNFSATAQPAKPYRIGVILPGGPLHEAIDGLRDGLRELGLEEGKQFALTIRDTKGDAKEGEAAAKNFEQEKVSLIYALSHLCHNGGKGGDCEYPDRIRRRQRSGRRRGHG